MACFNRCIKNKHWIIQEKSEEHKKFLTKEKRMLRGRIRSRMPQHESLRSHTKYSVYLYSETSCGNLFGHFMWNLHWRKEANTHVLVIFSVTGVGAVYCSCVEGQQSKRTYLLLYLIITHVKNLLESHLNAHGYTEQTTLLHWQDNWETLHLIFHFYTYLFIYDQTKLNLDKYLSTSFLTPKCTASPWKQHSA